MRIDERLEELRVDAPDRSLLGLETRVWAKIGEHWRSPSPTTLWGWRSATAALFLALGLLTQGASIAQPASSEFDLFSPHAPLAPSTLLGDGQ